MIKLKFEINSDTKKLDIFLEEEFSESFIERDWSKKALSYALQLNYTEDLLFIMPETIDMGAEIVFSEDYLEDYETFDEDYCSNEEGFNIYLDLSEALTVVGGINAPSVIAAKAVFEMLKVVNARCLGGENKKYKNI